MSAVDTYKTNGYQVITKALNSTYIVYKYYQGNDISQDGCIYARQFSLDANGSLINSKIALITIETAHYMALQNDSAVSDYVIQTMAG
jgi:hypothetical protein